MQLTFDSTEPLQHVLRVVESVYGVQLSITSESPVVKPGRSTAAKSGTSRPLAAKSTTKTTGTTQRSPSRNAAKTDPSIIRNWARANGHAIRDRGRVPATVLAAYKRSTKTTK